MPLELEYKPDAEEALKRVEAFWNCEIIDRPTIQIVCPNPEQKPVPSKEYETNRERWLDMDFIIECAQIRLSNNEFIAEAIPSWHPNLGPDVSAAAYGCALHFGDNTNTSWSDPILEDWNDIPKMVFNPDNEYIAWIKEFTHRALRVAKNKFIVGHTDIHPGGDLVAAIRDPQNLCTDLIDYPDEVIQLAKQVRSNFQDMYNLQYEVMLEAGQTVTTSWLPLFTDGKYYIPSNDFSCMISTRMFKKFFLDELIEETQWLDKSIYHLDGPDALKHLDTLLDIPDLNAIQWVYGAGQGRASDWLDVYKRIQAAGKGMHLNVSMDEIDIFMENLNPEGVMMRIGVQDKETADSVIQKISGWTKKK